MANKFQTKMLLFSCLVISSQAVPRFRTQTRKELGKAFDLEGAGSITSLAYAPSPQQPMQLTDNYNLIMPDYYDHHPAESMQLQNFAAFVDAEMSPGTDLGMEESQFLQSTPVRAPQPLSEDEKRIRQTVDQGDVRREKKALLKLKKGDTQPRGENYPQWEQFDYDLYSVNPGDSKKNSLYG